MPQNPAVEEGLEDGVPVGGEQGDKEQQRQHADDHAQVTSTKCTDTVHEDARLVVIATTVGLRQLAHTERLQIHPKGGARRHR